MKTSAADLQPIHLARTGSRVGFLCWPRQHGRPRRSPDLAQFTDDAIEAMFESAVERWATVSGAGDFGMVAFVSDHSAHAASIARLVDVGCNVITVTNGRARSTAVHTRDLPSHISSAANRLIILPPNAGRDLACPEGFDVLVGLVESARLRDSTTLMAGVSSIDGWRSCRDAGVTFLMGSVFSGSMIDNTLVPAHDQER